METKILNRPCGCSVTYRIIWLVSTCAYREKSKPLCAYYSGVARRVQRVLQHPPLASESAPQVPVTIKLAS